MLRQRTLLIISLSLLLPLVLVAPRASTHGGKTVLPALTISQDDKKITDGTSNRVDAYKKLLPELAAAHRKKLDAELERLKQFAEELSPQVSAAQKKTGFDSEAAMKEFRIDKVRLRVSSLLPL